MKPRKSTELFDVLAVNMESEKVRFIAQEKTQRAAESIEKMAILRRGVESEFFVTVPTGRFRNGDTYKPD